MSALFPLNVHRATTRRRGKTLVGPIDLTWDGQGTCVILGPNGSGKTTLLHMLHGTTRLSGGEIQWGCDLETARNAQTFVFQRPVMLRRTVRDNLVYPLRLRGMRRKAAQQHAETWAERVGLAEMLDRPATLLSGGEQQKLALARALIVDPALVFLDEPCAALDGRATRDIEAILREARAEQTRFMLSTHDLGQARRLADQVFFLLGGRVHESGPASTFFDGPQTSEACAFLEGDIVE